MGNAVRGGTADARLSLSFCTHRSSRLRHRSATRGKLVFLWVCWENHTGYVNIGEKFSYDSVSASDSLSFWDLTIVGRV